MGLFSTSANPGDTPHAPQSLYLRQQPTGLGSTTDVGVSGDALV